MKIHFIGIGGIGVSALARYFLAQGDEVSGSDAAESEIVEDLRKMGVQIAIGHKKENLDSRFRGNDNNDCLVIYSAAVREDNPELVEARRLGVKCQKYAEALGELTKKMYTIAISGMHGKSTTTAMIGLMMERAGLDPTVIVGTRVRWNSTGELNNGIASSSVSPRNDAASYSNFRAGKSKYLVIEADEYDRSFLNYWPKVLVLLNIEEEHLDTYTGGLSDIMKTFEEYASHLPEDGVLVANEEDENIASLINPKSEFLISPASPLACRGRAKQIPNPKSQIQKYNSNAIKGLSLRVPGQHNLSNANAALAVARVLGIDEKVAIGALNEFPGAWRRMEYKGEINGAKIFDDYGHHPTEIQATLAGARELLKKSHCEAIGRSNPVRGNRIAGSPRPFGARDDQSRLWVVFQPHQYHRTFDLFDKFVGAFGAADRVIFLPIYSVAGREDEEIKKKVSSELLVQTINNKQSALSNKEKALYMEKFDEAAAYLRKNLQAGDVCIIMGAGDIYKLTEKLSTTI